MAAEFGSSTLKSLGLDLNAIVEKVGASALRAYLTTLYPSEFEFYLTTIERTDINGNLLEQIIFPVSPQSINETRQSLVNIKKTNSSIVSMTNRTFAPTTITLNGTFGRKFRIMFVNEATEMGSSFNFKMSYDKKDPSKKVSGVVKSGYGTTKLLEGILNRSQTSSGSLLFLYNYALGNHYLVECTDMQFSQSMENNMFWNYSLNFKTLARAEDVYPGGEEAFKKSIKNQLSFSVLNRAVYELVRTLGSFDSLKNEALTKIGNLF